MSLPNNLNNRTFEAAVVETDGAGNIVVTRCTGGFKTTVAFLTDGTDGLPARTVAHNLARTLQRD